MNKYGCLMLILFLSACADRDYLAPVVGPTWHPVYANVSQYVVVRGDTLYSIAFRYDRDFRELARMNHLNSPYILNVGQVIHIKSAKQPTKTQSSSYDRVHIGFKQVPMHEPHSYKQSRGQWLWPARGRIVKSFMPQQGSKGIDIVGKRGDKIYASVGGVVAYAGNGLPGYGNLIIIKHNNQFLTAYGHNERNLVREGQSIHAGQVIAMMGQLDRDHFGVHFEIRQSGDPVNPRYYL